MNGKKKSFRTDIAYEELFEEVENEDCSYHVKRIQDVVVNHVKVHKEQNCLDKVVGDYIGIEFNELQDASIRKQIIEVCTLYLKNLLEQIYPIEKVWHHFEEMDRTDTKLIFPFIIKNTWGKEFLSSEREYVVNPKNS